MIEIYLKYDNMHIFGMINAFNYINNHLISCINSILSHFTRSETLREDKLTEFFKARTGALLETIESTIEMTNLGTLPLNSIPKLLLHKDTFSKVTIEEDIGHIELIMRPPLIHRQRENNMYLVKADHKGEDDVG